MSQNLKRNIINFDEIIEHIKDLVCHKYQGKVFDKEIRSIRWI